VKSSLTFLRKTRWARKKVEDWFIAELRRNEPLKNQGRIVPGTPCLAMVLVLTSDNGRGGVESREFGKSTGLRVTYGCRRSSRSSPRAGIAWWLCPYLAYLPEKDRLLMLVNCDYPHRAEVCSATIAGLRGVHRNRDGRYRRQAAPGMGTSLCYLGGGNVLFYGSARWFSRDYGQTWQESVPWHQP